MPGAKSARGKTTKTGGSAFESPAEPESSQRLIFDNGVVTHTRTPTTVLPLPNSPAFWGSAASTEVDSNFAPFVHDPIGSTPRTTAQRLGANNAETPLDLAACG